MIKRKAYQELIKWAESPRRKPLILRGARQVGKSTLIRAFSKEYDHFIELNMERAEDAQLFDLGNVTEIIEVLLVREGLRDASNTLLFIDEIQEVPRAIQLLRFFYEDLPGIHVITAGSLLEHALGRIPSFPVGRVQQMVLHPLDFEEYLWAVGSDVLQANLQYIPAKEHLHSTLMKAFEQYAMIGGMPEVVMAYLANQSIASILDVYPEIWETYKDDIEKYGRNPTDRRVLRHVVQTAPFEQDRISFAGFGNSNYKGREIGEALRSLDKARLIQLVYPITTVVPPQEVDFKRKPRLQFLDTGLLIHALNAHDQVIGLQDLSKVFRGRLIQHLVYQQLAARDNSVDRRLHFWVREKANSNAEVDLIYQHKEHLIPIEVKSGSHGRLRSLHEFVDRAPHCFAIRLLANKLLLEKVATPSGKSYLLLNLPYYLSGKIPEYAEWLVSQKRE